MVQTTFTMMWFVFGRLSRLACECGPDSRLFLVSRRVREEEIQRTCPSWGIMSCVTLVKKAFCLHAPLVQTPFSLFRLFVRDERFEITDYDVE